jgi:hypothetical protein
MAINSWVQWNQRISWLAKELSTFQLRYFTMELVQHLMERRYNFNRIIYFLIICQGVRIIVVGWGPMLQVGWANTDDAIEYFQLTQSFQPHYGPGIDLDPNKNEYQKSYYGVKRGRSVRLTTPPPSVSWLPKKCWFLDVSHLMGLHGLLQG